jgi:quinoprotein glucose dehydrogenase
MFRFSSLKIASSILIVALIWSACKSNEEDIDYTGWEKAHGNSNGNKYSSLTQIDTNNVMQLQVAKDFIQMMPIQQPIRKYNAIQL